MQGTIALTRQVFNEFLNGIIAALPKIFSGVLFLFLAYLLIKTILFVVRLSMIRLYPVEQRLIADFIVLVIGLFLWFAVGLAFLKIVGLGDIAASLGTAAGFIALGISYALSNMIADTVAGIYLLRDPDFNPGDHVSTESITGTVAEIGLRKSRFDLENGDRVVLANRDVDEKWTKQTTQSSATIE